MKFLTEGYALQKAKGKTVKFDFKNCYHSHAEWRDFVQSLQKKKPPKRREQVPPTGRHKAKPFKFAHATEGVAEIVANTLSEAKATLKRFSPSDYRWYHRVSD